MDGAYEAVAVAGEEDCAGVHGVGRRSTRSLAWCRAVVCADEVRGV